MLKVMNDLAEGMILIAFFLAILGVLSMIYQMEVGVRSPCRN
jgi:hypothetical protein